MAFTVGVLRERDATERRIAIVPDHLAALAKAGIKLMVERDAGQAAGFSDEQYAAAGGQVGSQAEVMSRSQVLAVINACVDEQWQQTTIRAGQLIIGYCAPYQLLPFHRRLLTQKASALAVEAIPRITRAQSMDVLSSMANISGYKAVLIAAAALPKLFPLMMTAAGTIVPAKVLVLGAGVAGLQAIATAKRLGAVVSAYDIRSEVKEQIESLGAHFVDVPLDTQAAAGSGGYAQQMDSDFYARQQELLAAAVRESDVIICTAAVPGKPAPVIISQEMVDAMQPGSVIVDIAAMSGGNCAYTEPDTSVEQGGVTILGPTRLPSTLPQTASALYSKNMSAILSLLSDNGELRVNREDEVIAAALIIENGVVRTAALQSIDKHAG